MSTRLIKYTPAQLLAIEILSSNPSISHSELAKKIQVERKTIHNWLTNSEFVEQLYKRYMEVAGIELPAVIKATIEEAKLGNVQAARLILEHFGKLENKVRIQIESPFEKFMKIDNAEAVEFVEINEEKNKLLDQFEDALDIDKVELPERDKSNDKPFMRERVERIRLNDSYIKTLRNLDTKKKQQGAYQIRKRAKAVGLPLLEGGRQSKATRTRWLEKLEKLENASK